MDTILSSSCWDSFRSMAHDHTGLILQMHILYHSRTCMGEPLPVVGHPSVSCGEPGMLYGWKSRCSPRIHMFSSQYESGDVSSGPSHHKTFSCRLRTPTMITNKFWVMAFKNWLIAVKIMDGIIVTKKTFKTTVENGDKWCRPFSIDSDQILMISSRNFDRNHTSCRCWKNRWHTCTQTNVGWLRYKFDWLRSIFGWFRL